MTGVATASGLPTYVLAHGIGERQDLPLPFGYVLAGAGAALVVSFLALGLLWRTPRLGRPGAGVPVPTGVARVLDSTALAVALRLLGLLATAYVGVAAVLGPDNALNPTAGAVYVLLWVGVPLASVLLGPLWRALNPLRTVHAGLALLLRTRPEQGLVALPRWVGYWPAVAGLLAFLWLELIAPDSATLPVIRTWFLAYAGVHLFAAAVFGSRWFDRGDAFEVFSAILGRLAPVGRRGDGRLVLRNPLDGLAGLRPAPGLVATVVVLLGGTAYDSLSGVPAWLGYVQASAAPELISTLALLGTCLLVGAIFYAGTLPATGGCSPGAIGLPGGRQALPGRRWALPGEFAHTIVPIALGYFVAHYYSLLILLAQQTLIRLSDPLGTGADWLGTADRAVDDTLVTPQIVATTQVLTIVTGHVLGVIMAHDRAVRLLPRSAAVRGQLPLLALMVAYTVAGLLLLFAA